jgi:hypothetical protein
MLIVENKCKENTMTRNEELRVIFWDVQRIQDKIYQSKKIAPEFVNDTVITQVYDELGKIKELISTTVII